MRAFGIRFVDGFWGRFGTLDAPLPRFITISLWIGLLLLVVVGLVAKADDGARIPWRPARVYLIAPIAFLSLMTISNSLLVYLRSSWAAGMQGRYVFAGLTGLVVVTGIGLRRLRAIRELHVLIVAVSLQLLALAVIFTRGGDQGGRYGLGAPPLLHGWHGLPGHQRSSLFACSRLRI